MPSALAPGAHMSRSHRCSWRDAPQCLFSSNASADCLTRLPMLPARRLCQRRLARIPRSRNTHDLTRHLDDRRWDADGASSRCAARRTSLGQALARGTQDPRQAKSRAAAQPAKRSTSATRDATLPNPSRATPAVPTSALPRAWCGALHAAQTPPCDVLRHRRSSRIRRRPPARATANALSAYFILTRDRRPARRCDHRPVVGAACRQGDERRAVSPLSTCLGRPRQRRCLRRRLQRASPLRLTPWATVAPTRRSPRTCVMASITGTCRLRAWRPTAPPRCTAHAPTPSPPAPAPFLVRDEP